jgi:hypothetical protein
MHKRPDISDLPNVPAIYVLYGGKGSRKFEAYVGITDKLHRRVHQHLIKRDSSVSTGTSVVSLNPDYVTSLKWWEYPEFAKKECREAAEIIAFKKFNPVLRSRGNHSTQAKELENDATFKKNIEELLEKPPTNQKEFPDFQDLLEKLNNLEREVEDLKRRNAQR